jgi:hypothetical protein
MDMGARTLNDISLADMKDVSLEEASRILGMTKSLLRPLWGDIPTAYRTPAGQYRVAVWGLRQWQATRGAK